MLFPILLFPCFSYVFTTFSSSEYYFDVPIDNPMNSDASIDLGYEDNMLDVLNGNVGNFVSLGYFNGYEASLDSYCICLVNKPRKIMWCTFFDFSYDFSMAFALLKKVLTLFARLSSCSLIAILVRPILWSLTTFYVL